MLDPDSGTIQIIDGNSFLLHVFRQSASGGAVRNTLNLVHRCKTPPVFVFDAKGGNDRRRAIYAPYKSKRTPPSEDLFASINLFKTCLAFCPAVLIHAQGWEADDVVATLARSYAEQGGKRVRVVTTDRDLYQLAVNPLIDVTASYEHIPPHRVRLFKTLVGDPSDSISGIPRFGEKSWLHVDYDAMEAMICGRVPVTFERLSAAGLGPAHAEWAHTNWDVMEAMWTIVGLMSVPQIEIMAGLKLGAPDLRAMDAKLKEFFL